MDNNTERNSDTDTNTESSNSRQQNQTQTDIRAVINEVRGEHQTIMTILQTINRELAELQVRINAMNRATDNTNNNRDNSNDESKKDKT